MKEKTTGTPIISPPPLSCTVCGCSNKLMTLNFHLPKILYELTLGGICFFPLNKTMTYRHQVPNLISSFHVLTDEHFFIVSVV